MGNPNDVALYTRVSILYYFFIVYFDKVNIITLRHLNLSAAGVLK